MSKDAKTNAPPAFKVLRRVEIDGVLYHPHGGDKADGVYADRTGKIYQHWYFAAMVTDGAIVPAVVEEPVDGSEALSAMDLIASAAKTNADNKPQGMSETQKADSAAITRAAEQTAKANAKATAARKGK